MMPNFKSADMLVPESVGAGSHLWLAMSSGSSESQDWPRWIDNPRVDSTAMYTAYRNLPYEGGARDNRADLLTKFLDGAQHHASLAMLPLLWSTTRCRTELAAVAAISYQIILTTPVEAKEDKEGDSSTMFGWTLVLVVAASAWLLGRRSSRVPKPRVRTTASQTDPIEPTIAAVEHYRWRDVPKMYVTQRGEKFHIRRPCAESRTSQPVREYERCLVCAPGPA